MSLLLYRNLVYSLLVAAAFKWGLEKFIHNESSGLVVDKSAWHYQYIGVIVLADEMCYLWNPCQAGTYLLVLVECH